MCIGWVCSGWVCIGRVCTLGVWILLSYCLFCTCVPIPLFLHTLYTTYPLHHIPSTHHTPPAPPHHTPPIPTTIPQPQPPLIIRTLFGILTALSLYIGLSVAWLVGSTLIRRHSNGMSLSSQLSSSSNSRNASTSGNGGGAYAPKEYSKVCFGGG